MNQYVAFLAELLTLLLDRIIWRDIALVKLGYSFQTIDLGYWGIHAVNSPHFSRP